MDLVFVNDQNCPLRPLVLKTDVTLVQTLRLIILDFFTWKPLSGDRHLYLDAVVTMKAWYGEYDTQKLN